MIAGFHEYVKPSSDSKLQEIFERGVLLETKRIGLLLSKMTLLMLLSINSRAEIKAVWVNNGQDKVTRDDLRATNDPLSVRNQSWDGQRAILFGAKNEVIAFNTILEVDQNGAQNVSVKFHSLTGPGGAVISSSATLDSSKIFNWNNRNIELFYIRYLQIKGLSLMSYETYDERHIPQRFRRPHNNGSASGTWYDRPDHDKFYPDIAVPMEMHPTFAIPGGSPDDRVAFNNQSIWCDIYIPKTVPAGLYTGVFQVLVGSQVVKEFVVELNVYNFTLPDIPSSKTMLYIDNDDLNNRFFGSTWDFDPLESRKVVQKHHLVAHRHKITLIDSYAEHPFEDRPDDYMIPLLDGTFFSSENGYAGPGVNTSTNLFVIGIYGSWNWRNNCTEEIMRTHSDNWAAWFDNNMPGVDYFLYLIDESSDFSLIESWASWVKNNPGVGNKIKTFATMPLVDAVNYTPSLSIPASWFHCAPMDETQAAYDTLRQDPSKRYMQYNGKRPASGSFCIEDDGVTFRATTWAQYKMKIDRWFFWSANYYNDYQSGMGQTNIFQSARVFGVDARFDDVLGRTGWNYSNGDGVLFYPGTDLVYPEENYGLEGPIASIRLKLWRRGIQDIDYLELAKQKDPARVEELLIEMVPKVLWENDVSDPNDPSWVLCDISWSNNPDVWQAVRRELAQIIDDGASDVNNPPVIHQLDATPQTIDDNETSEITASASDPDSDPFSYIWSASMGTIYGTGASVIYLPSQVTAQTLVTIVLEVQDTEGAIDTQQITVTVNPAQPTNNPPVIQQISADPQTINDNESSALEAIAIDPDGDTLTYTWSASMGSIAGIGSSVNYVPDPVRVQTLVTIMLEVQDIVGETDTEQITVTVNPQQQLNNPPVIQQINASPQAIYDNETSLITVEASDPDGDSLSFSWSVTSGTIEGTGANVTLTPVQVMNQTNVTISVEVQDYLGTSDSAQVTLSVSPSQPPNDEAQTPWASVSDQYRIKKSLQYDNKSVGYEFSPTQNGMITKLGGKFYGTAKLVLWKDAGSASASVMSTVEINNSTSSQYEWRFVNLPQPIAVNANSRYAVTVFAVYDQVRLCATRSRVPEEINIGDIVVHYPIVGESNLDYDNYPGQKNNKMVGQVDIGFVTNSNVEGIWSSVSRQYGKNTGLEFSDASVGFEFTPKTSGFIEKVGADFFGKAKLVLWRDAGAASASVITSVDLDLSNNASYDWHYIDLPEPVAVSADNRYAITMFVVYGQVELSYTDSYVPEELEFEDIVIHYPIVSETDRDYDDYPEYNSAIMHGQVDIGFANE